MHDLTAGAARRRRRVPTRVLAGAKGTAKLLLQTAYGHVGEAYPTLAALPVDGDRARFRAGAGEPRAHRRDMASRPTRWLAAGVVDGRNVWTNDLAASLDLLGRIQEHVPSERLMISASCSLLHVPYDVGLEDDLAGGGAPLARLRRAEAGRDRRPSPGR